MQDRRRCHDEIDHGTHEGPTSDRNDCALDSALLALLCSPQGIDDVGMFLPIVCLDGGCLIGTVATGAHKGVCQGECDEASEGEDKEGEELGLDGC